MKKVRILLLIDGMGNLFEKLQEHEEIVDNMFLAAKDFVTTIDLGIVWWDNFDLQRGGSVIVEGVPYVIKYVEWNNALINGEIGVLVELPTKLQNESIF
jgi:hypothetical protein